MILISLLLVFAQIVCSYSRQHVHELLAANRWHLYSVLMGQIEVGEAFLSVHKLWLCLYNCPALLNKDCK